MKCDLGNFAPAVEKILSDFETDMREQVESGLDEAQDYLIEQMKAASPKSSGDYAGNWKAGAKGEGFRTVKNDTTVMWNGKSTPLAGILEYSTKHAVPHIQDTRRRSRGQIIKILKKAIKG